MFQPVKGTEDFYPEKKAVQIAMFDTLRASAKSFGFQEVESPAMEPLSLLTAKSGEEIKSQLFTLEKKGVEELALRFDLTVPFTRMFVTKQKALPKPVKWFGISRMWRYEAPQKGRFREFYQLSVELFGSNRPEADAEIINLAIDCMNRFKLTSQDFMVRINNRKLLEGLLLQAGVAQGKLESVTRAIDKRGKVTEDDFTKLLLDDGLNQEVADAIKKVVAIQASPIEAIQKIKQLKLGKEAELGLVEFENVLAFLNPDYIVVDLSLARGLAYYTGTVFELSDRQGKYRAIAGGGRYDNLVELFGGEPCPAVGFAIGDKTLWLLLEEKGKLPLVDIGPEYYLISVTDEVRPAVVKLAAKLSRKTSCDLDLMGRKLTKQLEYANAIGARKVVVIGPNELKTGMAKVKDMKSGNETTIGIDHL
ncbi:histidine--tRNA ligase [Candidatus Woesearchaeota archaeon]|nr:histidine--tRNA ligase [Candidatus Woesearchaeota archaeon]